eukprot:m.127668 g.127668  ORF g.127668 m.127668 type:complete len:451 (-) comp16713_c1_seq1:28-1380(-)
MAVGSCCRGVVLRGWWPTVMRQRLSARGPIAGCRLREGNVQPRVLASTSASNSGALQDVKVVDLSRILAGPFATQTLADHGADVIKVERPHVGDDTRQWGPPFVGEESESTYFMSVNRNKRSIAVDMKTEAGRDVVLDLVRWADVLVENYLPGKLDDLGLGYDDVRKINPRLVYCSITGYGSDGPYAKRPGYDVMVSAIGGLTSVTGAEHGPPAKVGVAVTDICTGMSAVGGILAALLARYRTGRGQHVECSLLDTQVAMLSYSATSYLMGGKLARRLGTAHESIVPYEAFGASDGDIIIGALNNRQFASLCKALGVETLAKHDSFSTNAGRVKNRSKLIGLLREQVVKHSVPELETLLLAAEVPFGPINTIDQTFDDPHVCHRQLAATLPHSRIGLFRAPAVPTRLSETPGSVRTVPPLLDEHRQDVLSMVCGYSDDQIADLQQRGAFG